MQEMILGMLGALLCAAVYALGWFMGWQDAGRKEFGFFFPDDEEPEGKARQEALWQKVKGTAQPEDEGQSATRQAALSEEEKREIKRRLKAMNDIAGFCGPRTQKGGR